MNFSNPSTVIGAGTSYGDASFRDIAAHIVLASEGRNSRRWTSDPSSVGNPRRQSRAHGTEVTAPTSSVWPGKSVVDTIEGATALHRTIMRCLHVTCMAKARRSGRLHTF